MATLAALRNATSLEAQVAALRRLKNEIVGQDQRKQQAVHDGAVEALVSILSTSQEEEARLQATLVLGTLANGGPAFILPLSAAKAPQILLDSLAEHAGPRLVTASLQALRNIASSWGALQEGPTDQDPFARLDLFTKQSIDMFHGILRQSPPSPARNQHIRLITDLITLSATSESQKALLTHSPLLDTLAALLASHSIASKYIEYYGETYHLPSPPPATVIPHIISAICTLISSSTYRVHRFFLSPTIRLLFSQSWATSTDQRHLFGARQGFASTGEPLLPILHIPAYGTTTYHYGSRAFPAMAALQKNERRRQNGAFAVTDNLINTGGGDIDHANAVCSWLLLLTRSMTGHGRLVALKLLALVNNSVDAVDGGDSTMTGHSRTEHTQKGRERKKQVALLGVPLAVKMVQSVNEGKGVEKEKDEMLVKEQACEVLALLIKDFDELQVAAVDAGAIKHVCPLLKKTFDPVPLAKPMWSARKSTNTTPADAPATCRLGSPGLPSEVLHTMRTRRSALLALAALSEKEDLHRKAIVEAGVVPCIFESLKPFPVSYAYTQPAQSDSKNSGGNTVPVLLAACRAAQTMSRSVSLLRTSLIDNGIAKPVFALLKHDDATVRLAATDVCVNLLLEFSPMREDLIAEGVVRTLAEHAKMSCSGNEDGMKLRLSSLWALKHLVSASPRDVKIKALAEIGPGWLVGTIRGEHSSQHQQKQHHGEMAGGGVSVGMSTNAAGEQVDLLNPSSGMDVDEPEDQEGYGDDEEEVADDEDGEVMFVDPNYIPFQTSELRSTIQSHGGPATFNSKRYLSSVREIEQNPTLRAKQDDVAVQEQALDFVRNLLNGEDCAVMFDHLLREIGGTEIFELLREKLVPISDTGSTSTGTARPVYGPSALIVSTVNIITHIANALPRHKQLLISQKPLLQAWLPHFSHPDRKVRVACVWAVNSLTWIDDDSDRRDARHRVQELRACGIEGAVRALLGDGDLDVKERAKTAVRQFEQL